MKSPKYGNRKTVTADGLKFDSVKEARRWAELQLLERAGQISNLNRQVTYKFIVNGGIVGGIRPDFTFDDYEGNPSAEDVKGYLGPVPLEIFRLKCKLLYQCHGIRMRIVRYPTKNGPAVVTLCDLPKPS